MNPMGKSLEKVSYAFWKNHKKVKKSRKKSKIKKKIKQKSHEKIIKVIKLSLKSIKKVSYYNFEAIYLSHEFINYFVWSLDIYTKRMRYCCKVTIAYLFPSQYFKFDFLGILTFPIHSILFPMIQMNKKYENYAENKLHTRLKCDPENLVIWPYTHNNNFTA